MAQRRKLGAKRYPNGTLANDERGEREDQVMATALAQRARYAIPEQRDRKGQVIPMHEALRDQKAGTHLGRFLLAKRIDETQYWSGIWYAGGVSSFRSVMGLPKPTPGSPDAAMVSGGLSCLPEHDPEYVTYVRRRYADVFSALRDLEITGGEPEALMVLNEIAIWDRPIDHRKTGTLRSALNVVDRLRGAIDGRRQIRASAL